MLPRYRETRGMDQPSRWVRFRSATWVRITAAVTEATTRRLKERLEDVIVQHEQIANEIERTSEPNSNETAALSSETLGRKSEGFTRSPLGTTGRSAASRRRKANSRERQVRT